MRIAYKTKRFAQNSLNIIAAANHIIEEYAAQGFRLTLRQLYYQFVSRDWIANSQREYKRLGTIVSDGRLAGLIDWYAIEDRTRMLRGVTHWDSPSHIIEATADSFAMDRWIDQDYRVEVWIEKDALVGVIAGVCEDLDIDYFSCRGYVSQSEMWAAAQRLMEYQDEGQKPIILHLGDHDPSGLDMTRDIKDRLHMFMEGDPAEVIRLALTKRQINAYNPPPNPAKVTDSRARGYIMKHGRSSWELDALDPKVMADMIKRKVNTFVDRSYWDSVVEEEKGHLADLRQVAQNWTQLVEAE